MQHTSALSGTAKPCEGLTTRFSPSSVGIPFPDFPKPIKDFILFNADYFFLAYGIWDNHSELPIVIDPPARTMPQAHKFMHLEDFCDIQRGKQQALRFRAHNQTMDRDFLLKRNVTGDLLHS